MTIEPLVSQTVLDALRGLDTCTVSNAIDTFNVRLYNAGFADSSIRSMLPELPPMVGYAATARMRSAEQPVQGGRYRDRSDWWANILTVPEPRVVVIQDMDEPPGRGAFLGDVHAAILKALGCVGYVSNGAVRELPRVRNMQFSLFAGSVAVSHAYAHIFDCCEALTIGGLEIRPGDLLHGDVHGLLSVPKEIAAKIPDVAGELRKREDQIVEYCQSPGFSVKGLCAIFKKLC